MFDSQKEKAIDDILKNAGLADDKPLTAADIRSAIAKLIITNNDQFESSLERSFEYHLRNYHNR